MTEYPLPDAVAAQINQVGNLSKDMGGAIDSLFGGKEPAPDAPEPVKATETPSTETKPAEPTKPANEPVAKEPTEPKKPAEQPVPKGPKELRQAYDTLKAERDQLVAKSAEEVKSAKDEVARLRSEIDQAKANGASKEEIESLRKEAAEASEQLKLTKYEASKEFKDQFDKPWNESRDSLLKNLTSREWKDPSGNRFTPSATDVWKLLSMDDVSASEYIHETFSASVTGLISQWRDKAISAYNARSKALEDWHGKHKEWEEKQARDQEANSAKIRTWLGDEESSLSTKEPDFYKRPDDSVLGSKYDEGASDVDKAFNRHPANPAQNPTQRLEEVIRAQGRISSRAKAFPVLTEKLKSANARIAELEAKLNGYKKSEPNPSAANSRGAKPAKQSSSDIGSQFDQWLQSQGKA
jgi:hypothetical protein